MKKIVRLCLEVISEMLQNVLYVIANNLYHFGTIINFICPYLCLYLGQTIYQERGHFAVGGELLLPLLLYCLTVFLQRTANRIGKGIDVPTPQRRFTSIDKDGEITISNNRLEELIIYMADLEDWMEKEGVAKWKR